MGRDRVIILIAGFAIAAFAGLAAYFRLCKEQKPSVLGVLTALSNGGCMGIIVCGFCYWKWEDKVDPMLVFGMCSAFGLGGVEMVNLIVGIIRHKLSMRASEEWRD